MHKQNIGNTQHMFRTYGGGVMGILVITYAATMGLLISPLMLFMALFLIITGEIRWCPCVWLWQRR